MTNRNLHQSTKAAQAKHKPVYDDSYRIGQHACAVIRRDIARDELVKISACLLSTEYQPMMTLPMLRRMYDRARAEYDTARMVLS